jgi:sugar phosphate isomerase/epimerase
MYSVRDQMKDVIGTVRAVAKMGYDGVEFYGPYFAWTPEFAKQVRSVLDEVKMKCYSTHNGPESFAPANHQKAIDLNSILGSKIIVMASAGRVNGIAGWEKVAETLTAAEAAFKQAKIDAGYHNHAAEFKPIDGVRPLDVIAKNTPKDVVMQLDIGTCVEMGQDPAAFINANKGRVRSIHCKDWSKEKGYRVLFGEGAAPWKDIFAAAEKNGVQYYLIEQEGADVPSLEAVDLCLKNIRKMRA